MVGIATVTMLPSSTAISALVAMTARARRGAAADAADAGDTGDSEDMRSLLPTAGGRVPGMRTGTTVADSFEVDNLSREDLPREFRRSRLAPMTSLAPAPLGDIAACAAPDLSFLLDHTSHALRTRMAAALAEVGMTARMH